MHYTILEYVLHDRKKFPHRLTTAVFRCLAGCSASAYSYPYSYPYPCG